MIRVVKASAVLLLSGAAIMTALGGCTVDVLLGFEECSLNGASYKAGDEAIPAGDGCNTCSCNADGTVTCTRKACGCVVEGTVDLAPFDSTFTAGDGCNTCTCLPDGTVTCTKMACPLPCNDPPIMCSAPAIVGCESEPICVDGAWDCSFDCNCNGDTGIPVCPDAPLGCYFTGPYCDGLAWSCGDLICDGCQSKPEPCPDPGIPGCWAESYCDGFNWGCITNCDPCMMIPPPEDCLPTAADCIAYPYCDPMYGQWMCMEECAMPGCVDPVPPCDDMAPQCLGQPTCIDSIWYCEYAC
jgi:hypothetical protein